MSTESIKSPSKTLTKHYESYGVFRTLIASGALNQNMEVYISGNNTVAKRTTGAQYPVGVVTVGAADGELATVHLNVMRDSLAKAIGSALSAGTLVRPNGNVDADGVPEYVACTAGNYANAIVLKGGNQNAEITILILRAAHIVPTP